MKQNKYPTYKRKIVVSGSHIELIKYEVMHSPGGKTLSEEEKIERRILAEQYRSGELSPDDDKLTSSLRRAKSGLKRLIYTNSWAWRDRRGYPIPPKLLTLTFKENITDVKTANYALTKYVQRLNYQFRNILADPLKYVCVPEFQKRGAVHYHMVLFNFPFIDKVYSRLRHLWGDSRINLKTIKHRNNINSVFSYVAKYISKEMNDCRLWGKRRYFPSDDLKKPIEIHDDIAIEMICQRLPQLRENIVRIPLDYGEDLEYSCYNLEEGQTLHSLPALDKYVKKQLWNT